MNLPCDYVINSLVLIWLKVSGCFTHLLCTATIESALVGSRSQHSRCRVSPLGIPVIGWIGARDGSLRSLLRIRRVSRSSRQQTCVGLSHASRSRMDDALKTAVAAGFVTFSYPAGSQLYAKGAVCEETHILLSGESAASTYPDFHLRIPLTETQSRSRMHVC